MSTISKIKSLDTLLPRLSDMAERHTDILVPVKTLTVATKTDDFMDENGMGVSYTLELEASTVKFGVMRQAVSQLTTRLMQDKKVTIPASYLHTLLDAAKTGQGDFADVAQINVEHWLDQVKNAKHTDGRSKKWQVRLESSSKINRDDDGCLTNTDLRARAILTDKFFAVDNLPLIESIVTAIAKTDQANAAGKVEFVDWRVAPSRLDLMLVNRGVAFDLKNPNQGIVHNPEFAESNGFMRIIGETGTDSHWVFPAARVTNSETGHAGLVGAGGLFEAVCANKSVVSTHVVKRHVGRIMDGTAASARTAENRRSLVLSEVADSVAGVFDTSVFEENCLKFAGLWEYKVEDIEKTVETIVTLAGLPQDAVARILTLYNPLVTGKNTLGDVQRAVTNMPMSYDVTPEATVGYENAGGMILQSSPDKKRQLLSV